MKTIVAVLILYFSDLASIHFRPGFYQGKTLNVGSRRTAGRIGGSTNTGRGQFFLSKQSRGIHLIVAIYAGRRWTQAANHVYKVAKPDGLTVGSMGAALVANACWATGSGSMISTGSFIWGRPTARTLSVHYAPDAV